MTEDRLRLLEEENSSLKDKVKHLEDQLSMAIKLKYHIMPNSYPAFPDVPGIDVFADSLEIEQIGGDYYDFFRIDADHIGIVIADVFDGGYASALYMVSFKLFLVSQLSLDDTMEERIATVNDFLCWNECDDLCLSAWYGIYEISTGKVKAVNAGHDKPLILTGDGVKEIESEKISYILGVMEGMQYESYEFTLDKGEKLLLYTDGVVKAKNSLNEQYTLERLKRSFENTKDSLSEMSVIGLQQDFREFVGNGSLKEDATFLCFTRKEGDQ